MKEKINIAASVRQHLLNLARERGEDFQQMLVNYALERLLYRLAQSGYRERSDARLPFAGCGCLE